MTHPKPDAGPAPALSAAGREFLRPPRYAVAATINPDGSPLQAVIWYRLEGDTIVFNSRVGRQWPANLERDRRVSVIVANGEDYVDLRGEVEIDDDPETGLAVISALARRYEPTEEAAAIHIAAFAGQHRVTFTLRPSKIFERLSGD